MSILSKLNYRFRIEAKAPASTEHDIHQLLAFSERAIPSDFLAVIRVSTEVELLVDRIDYIRLWGALGVIEMNVAYDIQRYLPGSLAIGDDEGGKALILLDGSQGSGLYLVPFGALAVDEAIYISRSLTALLVKGEGVKTLFGDR